jgi:ABC-type glutathione transport system ATPase component
MIEISQLSIQFKNSNHLLFDGFSIKIQQGEKILLVGPSGSGKSVLLKTIMGVMPKGCVRAGQFRVLDHWMDYSEYQHHVIHQRFSAIFQDAVNSLHPYRSIAHQFEFAPQDELIQCCDRFRLQYHHVINSFSRQLSGGQCQRISIMFPYLLKHQDIIVFDEPITDIDPISHNSILKQIKSTFLTKPDKTVLYVTHQHDEIKDIPFKRFELIHQSVTERKVQHVAVANKKFEPHNMPVMQVNIPRFQYPVSDIRQFSLQQVIFSIYPGDSIGILGESGSGKSTLLKIMAGLIPTQDKQQVKMRIASRQLIPLQLVHRKSRYAYIQIVFQDNVGSLFEDETIEQSLIHIRKIKDVQFQDVLIHAKRFFQKLSLIGINDQESDGQNSHRDSFETFLHKKIVQLSMGMVRRFCLAKALLLMNIYTTEDRHTPKLILLDEISRGLDQANKARLVEFIHDIQRDYSLSVIAISHEQDFLMSFCDQFYFMFEGFQIPKAYSKKDLLPANVNQIKNTYLRRYFLPCEEPEPYQSASDRPDTGCFFQQFYRCPEQRSECIQSKEETWTCV